MTEEDKKYRQGRSKYQVEQTEKVAGITILVCLGLLIVLSIINKFL